MTYCEKIEIRILSYSGLTLAVWTEGWTGSFCVDIGLDRLLLCGQREGQAHAVWTDGCTDPCWVDRGLDRLLLCGQRVGQALAGWVDRGLDRLLQFSVGQALSVWTGLDRPLMCGQGWTGSFCVDSVRQDIAMWTECWTGYCYVDRGLDRILLCGQRAGQDIAMWTEG